MGTTDWDTAACKQLCFRYEIMPKVQLPWQALLSFEVCTKPDRQTATRTGLQRHLRRGPCTRCRPPGRRGLLVERAVGFGVAKHLKVRFVQLVQFSPHGHGDLGKPVSLPAGRSAVSRPRWEAQQAIHLQELQQALRVRFQGL